MHLIDRVDKKEEDLYDQDEITQHVGSRPEVINFIISNIMDEG